MGDSVKGKETVAIDDLVEAILIELRPYKSGRKAAETGVRGMLALLPSEVAEKRGRVSGGQAAALKYAEELCAATARVQQLLILRPARLGWILDMACGEKLPFDGTLPPYSDRRRSEATVRKGAEFRSILSRISFFAKFAEQLGLCGPSPNYDPTKALAAEAARFLILAHSRRPPKARPEKGPMRVIGGVIFDFLAETKDADVGEWACKEALKRGKPRRSRI